MLTWGDGVADIDLKRLLDFHRSHGKLATVTAVRPPARFGRIELDGDQPLRDAHAIGAGLRRKIIETYPQCDVIVHKDVARDQ